MGLSLIVELPGNTGPGMREYRVPGILGEVLTVPGKNGEEPKLLPLVLLVYVPCYRCYFSEGSWFSIIKFQEGRQCPGGNLGPKNRSRLPYR